MGTAGVGTFSGPEELMAQFALEALEGYIRHTVVTNMAAAFSCYLAYPSRLRYKPPPSRPLLAALNPLAKEPER